MAVTEDRPLFSFTFLFPATPRFWKGNFLIPKFIYSTLFTQVNRNLIGSIRRYGDTISGVFFEL
jgi:hypothetical protein